MGRVRAFRVSPDGARQRLDLYLSQRLPEVSRSQARRLILEGRVTVNQRMVKPSYLLRPGDAVGVAMPEAKPLPLEPEPIPLDILYEDAHLLVVNKPAGMVVHPGAGVSSGTLVNAILAHCRGLSRIGGAERPGIVHRLDKETSGLLMVAKDDATHRHLSAQLSARRIKREYLALVRGVLSEDEGTIDHPIGRHPVHRKRMSVLAPKGRSAVTSFRVLERFRDYTLLELWLRTGRTHQIRVHMASLGHPVAGDTTYGGGVRPGHGLSEVETGLRHLSRIALHACHLGFRHPESRDYIEFTSPLPPELQEVLDCLRQREGRR